METLTNEKNDIFDQLQLRQAELESSQSHLESLQNSNNEIQFQLREAVEKVALLSEELNDVQRQQDYATRRPQLSSEDVAQIRAKYESQLSEVQSSLAAIEIERNETEATLNLALKQKNKECEELRRIVDSSAHSRTTSQHVISSLKQELERANNQLSEYRKQASEFMRQSKVIEELEVRSLSVEHDMLFLSSGHRLLLPSKQKMPGLDTLNMNNKSKKL